MCYGPVQILVDGDDRRQATTAETPHLFEAEIVVVGRAAHLYLEHALECLKYSMAALDVAGRTMQTRTTCLPLGVRLKEL